MADIDLTNVGLRPALREELARVAGLAPSTCNTYASMLGRAAHVLGIRTLREAAALGSDEIHRRFDCKNDPYHARVASTLSGMLAYFGLPSKGAADAEAPGPGPSKGAADADAPGPGPRPSKQLQASDVLMTLLQSGKWKNVITETPQFAADLAKDIVDELENGNFELFQETWSALHQGAGLTQEAHRGFRDTLVEAGLFGQIECMLRDSAYHPYAMALLCMLIETNLDDVDGVYELLEANARVLRNGFLEFPAVAFSEKAMRVYMAQFTDEAVMPLNEAAGYLCVLCATDLRHTHTRPLSLYSCELIFGVLDMYTDVGFYKLLSTTWIIQLIAVLQGASEKARTPIIRKRCANAIKGLHTIPGVDDLIGALNNEEAERMAAEEAAAQLLAEIDAEARRKTAKQQRRRDRKARRAAAHRAGAAEAAVGAEAGARAGAARPTLALDDPSSEDEAGIEVSPPLYEADECVMCLDARPSIVFGGCRHCVCCDACTGVLWSRAKATGKAAPECPYCRVALM